MVIYPEGHPKAAKAWYELDITGMDQQTIDIFIGEIRRYFAEVDIVNDKIVYRSGSIAEFEYYNHLYLDLNLPSKHTNVKLVCDHIGGDYNDVWNMSVRDRLTLVNLIQKYGIPK